MPAQVAAAVPIDPAPPVARLQAPASSSQFLNLLALPKPASASHFSTSTSDGSATATVRVASTSGALRPNGSQNATSDHGSSGDPQNNGNQHDPANGDGAARVMVVPVPVPPQPVPQPASGAVSIAGTPGLAGNSTVPPPTPSSPADAALLLLAANTLAATAAPTSSGATGTAGTGTSAASSTATPGQSAPSAQVLPSMAATLSMRLAASALTLVSQPRVTLASATPEITAPTKPLGGSEADLAAIDHAALLTDVTHGSSKSVAAAAAGGIDDLLASAAKDAVGAASQLAHNVANETSATSVPAEATAGSDGVPQIAAMTPPPPSLANELPAAMPIPPHVVAEQVAVSLRQAVSSGSDHIQIQLQPADLGAVNVKLSINHDGRVTMVVSADRSDTLNLLQQDAGGLAQALRDVGLQADSSSLSFNLRGGYQFNQQQGAFAGASLVGDASAAGSIDGIDTPPATALRAHAGSLDIHV
jgi:flagellar hook-length control protein FliK